MLETYSLMIQWLRKEIRGDTHTYTHTHIYLDIKDIHYMYACSINIYIQLERE